MDSETKLDLEKDDFQNNDMIDLSNPKNNVENTVVNTTVSQSSSEQKTDLAQVIAANALSFVPKENKEEMANNIINNVGSSLQKTWLDKILCCLNFLRPYFQLNTKELLSRLKCSFIPINAQFFEIAMNKPDLYGPFWIYTTLIFVIAAAGSLSNYFGSDKSGTGIFDVRVPLVGTIIYSLGFFLPLLLFLAFKFVFTETSISYIQCLCIYGYSLTVFVPVMVLCALGINFIQWIFLFYGCVSSTMFVLFNFWKIFSVQDGKKRYLVIGGIILVQLAVFFTFKYCLSYDKSV
ncbi:MAG: YIP1 family protein [archaeon]|nr:YIP1 family protein [archaeon]